MLLKDLACGYRSPISLIQDEVHDLERKKGLPVGYLEYFGITTMEEIPMISDKARALWDLFVFLHFYSGSDRYKFYERIKKHFGYLNEPGLFLSRLSYSGLDHFQIGEGQDEEGYFCPLRHSNETLRNPSRVCAYNRVHFRSHELFITPKGYPETWDEDDNMFEAFMAVLKPKYKTLFVPTY